MELGDLRLDRPTLDDVPAIHEIYRDPRVWTHFPSGRFAEIASTEKLIASWIEGWERHGLAPWIVRDRESGEVLGNCGCTVRQNTFWNLGYRLAFSAHGRGIASKASAQAISQAQRMAPQLPVVAFLLEHNIASARVAEKCGLNLVFRGPDAGNPDPEAVRLIYADRELSQQQLDATLS